MTRARASAALCATYLMGTALLLYVLDLSWLDWEICFEASGGKLETRPTPETWWGDPRSSATHIRSEQSFPVLYALIFAALGAAPGLMVIAFTKSPALWSIQSVMALLLLGYWTARIYPPETSHSCNWDGVHDALVRAPSLLILYAGALALLSLPVGRLMRKHL